MKVHIRRQGIVIRTVEIKGDKASIGSGADCEIRIDDPYLGAHVADIVNRGGEWRIVDQATSLEAVEHGGRRIEDEPLVPGESYTVGAFEIVPEGAAPSAPVQAARPQAMDNVSPQTVVQSFEDLRGGSSGAPIPKTYFEQPVPGGIPGSTPPPPPPAPPQAYQQVQAQPSQMVRPAATAAAPPAAKKRSKLPLLLALFGLMFVIVLIAIVMMFTGGGDQTAETTTAPAATPTPAPVQPTTPPAEQGEQFAANLEVDKALEAWEKAIASGGNDPLRARYATLAMDAAMVHAAANDAAKSKAYLERVVKFGPPDSPQVADARARLGS